MKKTMAFIMVIAVVLASLCSCGRVDGSDGDKVRIGVMRGATAMGMLGLMESASDKYDFELQSEAGAFVSALYKGETDIAAVPSNLASVIYNNSDGSIKMLAVNTLNVLYIVERGESIKALSDIAGKKLYATGEAAVPEYVLRHILDNNGLTGENAPSVQWCSDTTEVLAYLSSDEKAIAMLPQPFVSVAQLKLNDVRIAVDMGEEWHKLEPESDIVTGVIVAREEFISEHPDELAAFLERYKLSVLQAQSDAQGTAMLAEKFGIISKEAALNALPSCGISYIDGTAMHSKTEAFLSVLLKYDTNSIGGKLPDGGFYYE